MMVEEADRIGARWRDGDTINLDRDLAELTLRVVSRSLFSHEVAGDVAAITGAVASLQESFSQIEILPSWVPLPRRRRARHALQAIDSVMYRLIAARRIATAPEAASGTPDLLHMLLKVRDDEGDGAGLTDTEVRDQLVTFYLAGHETTSQALTWTMYLLALHPEVEARLYAELAAVLGERAPGFEDVEALQYTERVVRESMRLYPPVYALARKAAVATAIGDYTVPAGSDVALWIYLAHHDPRWFPQPERFNPDRYDDAATDAPRHAYLPFGSGARTCVGKTFAMIEAVLILATIARRWRLRVAPDQRIAIKTRVTLMPKFGMRMIVERR
jgi:cytochrome P450